MENIATLSFPDTRAGDDVQVNVRVSPEELGLALVIDGEWLEVFMPLPVGADLVRAVTEGLDFAGWREAEKT